MPVPLPGEMILFCAAVAALQFAFTFRFLSRSCRRGGPGPAHSPPVSVIIPCKGVPESLAAGVRSLLDQDYAGTAEYIFVVPAGDDPAFAALGRLLAGDSRARVSVSGAEPDRCSEKVLNLLHGRALASPGTSVLVFADADLVFPRSWLSELVAPLRDPSVAVSTAHALPAPGGFAGDLMRLWTGYGIVYMDLLGVVSGNSAALSKEDFEGLGVERVWRGALCEDIELGRLARRAGRGVRFAAGAVPTEPERRTLRQVLAVTGKWTFYFKYYGPLLWGASAALTAFKLYAAAWAFLTGQFPPLLLLLAGDAVNLSLVSAAFAGRAPGPAAGMLRCALLTPALLLLHAANFVSAAFRREVVWGGRRYRLVSASDVRVLPAAGGPLSAWAAPGPVMIVSGALAGAAFLPG
ncbi:MAG: glycosyltransferase, partial [Elusimicrobiota bacterium]